MRTARTIREMRKLLETFPKNSAIGFVPTMGALHIGHRALFDAAVQECDVVVASIFVNPAQFGDQTDFLKYPRDEARDVETASECGVTALFLPENIELYPAGYATWLDVSGDVGGAENKARPGHFRGVATICVKLFHIVGPQVVYFGQKDAHQ